METQSIRKQRDLPMLAFALCIGLIVLVIVAQCWWSIRVDRNLTRSDAEQHSYFTVRILEEHASRGFVQAVQTMDAVTAQLEHGHAAEAMSHSGIDAMLRTELARSQFLFALNYFDTEGRQRASSRAFTENFQPALAPIASLRSQTASRELVAGAARLLPASELWILPIARNVYDARGQWLGILEAEVKLSYFQEFYEMVARGSAAAVSLHDRQGDILARAPFDPAFLARPLVTLDLLAAITGTANEGVLESGSLLDGSGNFQYTYRKISGTPLTLVYAKSIPIILSDWQERAQQKRWITVLTVLFILALAWILSWQVKRLQISKAKFDASEDRYRLLFTGALDAIFLIGRDYHYVDCNLAAVRMYGMSRESDIIGRRVGSFSSHIQVVPGLVSSDRNHMLIELIDLAFAGEPQCFEWRLEKDGRPFFIEISLSPVELNGDLLLFCLERDINARKYTDRLLEGQNRLLQLIGGNEDPIYILNAVSDFVEDLRPSWCVGIQLLADDQRTFVQGTGHRFPPSLLAQFNGLPVTHGSGIWSEAVLVACPVKIDQLQQAPCMQFVNGLEQLAHFPAGVAWPLMDKHGQVLGSFTVLQPDTAELNDEDMSLVGIMIEIASIAIEGRRSEKKILQLAHYDELTGLPNRFLYHQHLAKALSLAERKRSRLAVLFLDLDRFKNINDTFGHDEGDKVLASVAQRFRRTLRESDIIARVGGDEFILLIDQFNEPRDLGDIADKLLFEAAQPFEIYGQECQLSASIGIATFPNDGRDAQTLLKNADIAMYRAKNKGKDNYQFYASEMNTHTVERLAFEARLRKALERREFLVYYQPKVDVASGLIVGAEALVRWNHPERGILYPNDFIMLAEEAGLIARLGMLVLDIACRDVLSFRQLDKRFGRIAINLSGSQFNDIQLLEEIQGVVDFWRVPANAIEFEITESMVMHNREQAIVLMDGFKAAGFTLSIDDFGTGYSSLAYLKRFPVDSVKVDRSFIKDIPHDPNDTAIVLAIVAMAHTLGLKVIAEGVDDIAQLETLQKFNCDEYQGFYFSKAIPAKEFQQLLIAQTIAVG
ncbi:MULTISPECIES: EAL domain-containing protein [unclassified Undibacterium]|uniref:EAL domain-containing protein n=1 Tax=unclassified Undibacterium TaxID=2630295 RepID=UPI002AC9840A|nr:MULTISPECIES: EAL domain-containing protein [unclassified Undibacterium]MEB0138647.1 EAL domain-containing protein [Undibacterium sp. CCC2.1]MEB0171448.1 EAL domain-containing protein [Undibacterium sp. CCC1.1]MEB0175778.1 EAL domain-containing protein [Undibacterium sp. CCC3.4]MEB0214393.1 EAL domain-containing protein [Undibacterium sp. 5I2]WPX44261.1 EAL domain-containing protein [Undibacterium sp. CCC3.4]